MQLVDVYKNISKIYYSVRRRKKFKPSASFYQLLNYQLLIMYCAPISHALITL